MTLPVVSHIGGTVAISAAAPATYNSAGYGALSWTTVADIVSWGQIGDSAAKITVTPLSGRVEKANGELDGGDIAFTMKHVAADAGQAIVLAQANTNTNVSIRLTDPDGKIYYSTGLLANVRGMERTATAYKGYTGEFRVNSVTVTV